MGPAQIKDRDHGRRKDFFYMGTIVDFFYGVAESFFSREGAAVVKFNFTNSK